MSKVKDIHTEASLMALNKAYARLKWIERGAKKDGNIERESADYFDARRIIGFIAADGLLEIFIKGYQFDIPRYYFDYLNSLSIDEYKKIKAYTIWERNDEIIDDDLERMEKDYLEACSILPCEENTKGRERIHPSEILEYINDDSIIDKHKIKERKAFWCHLSGRTGKGNNWYEAHNYVEKFYSYAKSAIIQGHENIPIDYFDLVHNNHHIANMFEVCFLMYLQPKK